MADLTDALTRMCDQFEESETTTRTARQLSERDRDYYDEKQWTAAEEAALRKRNQPVVTFNRIKRKVNALLGLEKQSRKDPKAFPRNPQDEKSAHAATDAIRYVCDDSRWDDVRSSAGENLIIEGTGAIMVGVKKTKQGLDPEIVLIRWDRLYYDPHASAFDFADAAYMGLVIWMDFDKAVRKWPDRKEELESTLASVRSTDTYDDRPKAHLWADPKRKRVRICEHYYDDGGWKRCVFTKGGFLEDPEASPYLDEEGQPENPIKAVSLYIDRENNRYGEVRTLIGPQDEINKRRSKALHLISQRQVRVSRGTGQDAKEVRAEMSKPDGVLVGESGEVEVLQTNDMAQANLTMLQEAKNEIDLLSINAALAGKGTQEQSGRAIIAQQQGGMLEAATILDRIRVLSLATYRAVWCRIRQHWTAERWVRVTDSEQNMRFVGLNRPVTMLEAAAEKFGITRENYQQMAQQKPQEVQQLALLAQSPEAKQVVRVDNAVGELDVDILVDEGIDTPTVAAEQFETLAKIMPGIVNLPPHYAKLLIQASSLRNKEEMLETFEQNEPSPEEQQMKQLQMRGAMAQVAETESKVMLNQAKAGAEGMQQPEMPPVEQGPTQLEAVEAMGELEIKRATLELKREEVAIKAGELAVDRFRAETERMEAMKPDPVKAAA